MSKITVKELIKELQIHDQNSEICFGPDKHFTYYKVTDNGLHGFADDVWRDATTSCFNFR